MVEKKVEGPGLKNFHISKVWNEKFEKFEKVGKKNLDVCRPPQDQIPERLV